MNEKCLIHKEIFKREPDLQENVFITQRLYETEQFLKKKFKRTSKR